MKPLPIAGHLAAFAAGCFLAGRFAPDVTGRGDSSPPERQDAAAKSAARERAPEDLLGAMVMVPMTPDERYSLRAALYGKWARTDPLGLLKHLEGRAWVSELNFASPFSALAESRPKELLRYAREAGCTEALKELTGKGDPRANLELLLEDAGYTYPEEVYKDIFERGEEHDPEFHQRIAALPDDAAKRAALRVVAKVMVENLRHDDYFALLRDHGDLIDAEDAAGAFAEIVFEDPARLDHFDSLPEAAQATAVNELVTGLSSRDDSDREARQLLPLFAERGWLDDQREELAEIVMANAQDENGEPVEPGSTAWKDWALGLPVEGQGSYLRDLGIARWAMGDPGNEAAFDQLPEPRLQDSARVGAIMACIGRHDLTKARQVARGIHHAPRREVMLKALQILEGEGPMGDFEGLDPFAPEETAE